MCCFLFTAASCGPVVRNFNWTDSSQNINLTDSKHFWSWWTDPYNWNLWDLWYWNSDPNPQISHDSSHNNSSTESQDSTSDLAIELIPVYFIALVIFIVAVILMFDWTCGCCCGPYGRFRPPSSLFSEALMSISVKFCDIIKMFYKGPALLYIVLKNLCKSRKKGQTATGSLDVELQDVELRDVTQNYKKAEDSDMNFNLGRQTLPIRTYGILRILFLENNFYAKGTRDNVFSAYDKFLQNKASVEKLESFYPNAKDLDATYNKSLVGRSRDDFGSILSERSTSDGLCLICQGSFKAMDQVYVLPCLHFYDVECFDQWIKTRSQCPKCSANVFLNENYSVKREIELHRVELEFWDKVAKKKAT